MSDIVNPENIQDQTVTSNLIPSRPIIPSGERSSDSMWDIYSGHQKRLERLIQACDTNIRLNNNDNDIEKMYRLQRSSLKDEMNLLRLPNINDITYRKKLSAKFPLLAVSTHFSHPIRFHGTSIMAAKNILNSGSLSSAVDHAGFRKSNDISGQISVTSPKDCEISLRDYTRIHDYALPQGCLFVLLPKDETEIESSANNMIMRNVTLKNPDRTVSNQFYRILASPEMLPGVQEWLKNNGYNTSLASEYFQFLSST